MVKLLTRSDKCTVIQFVQDCISCDSCGPSSFLGQARQALQLARREDGDASRAVRTGHVPGEDPLQAPGSTTPKCHGGCCWHGALVPA